MIHTGINSFEQINDLLLEVKWWNWSDEDIKKYSDVLKSKRYQKN
jgi:hypothetical protein